MLKVIVILVAAASLGAYQNGHSASPTSGEAGEDNKKPSVVVEEIRVLVTQCVDKGEAIDIRRLAALVSQAEEWCTKLDAKHKEELIAHLGRTLTEDTQKITVAKEALADYGFLDPRDLLKEQIVAVFSALKDKRALPHLESYIRLWGHKAPKDTLDRVSTLIEKLGGKVPMPIEVEKRQKAEEAKRLAEKCEAEELLARLKAGEPDPAKLSQIMTRLGEIGDESAVDPIMGAIRAKGAHWIVKQNGLEALGRLGGAAAQAFLVEALTTPMPAKANLDDYGEVEAILRSVAARGLGRCGDKSAIELLARVASDSKQYVRVREAARGALSAVRDRVGAKPPPATMPARELTEGDRILVSSLIEKLKRQDLGRDERLNALRSLGVIGGPQAKAYLGKLLESSLPAKADIANDAEDEAVFRSQAALALGQCGDKSGVKLLERLANDPKQYRRVQRSCQEALGELRARLE
jgi:HEAT repeat protein